MDNEIEPRPPAHVEKIADRVATVLTGIVFLLIAMVPLTVIVLIVKYVWFA
jgi:hypothetical protein